MLLLVGTRPKCSNEIEASRWGRGSALGHGTSVAGPYEEGRSAATVRQLISRFPLLLQLFVLFVPFSASCVAGFVSIAVSIAGCAINAKFLRPATFCSHHENKTRLAQCHWLEPGGRTARRLTLMKPLGP